MDAKFILVTPPDPSPESLDLSRYDTREDSDDWLTMDPDLLEGMLTDRAPEASKPSQSKDVESDQDRIYEKDAKRLQELSGEVQAFVNAPGDVEGAKFDELSFSFCFRS